MGGEQEIKNKGFLKIKNIKEKNNIYRPAIML